MIRIDRAARDPRELLDPENWISCNWGGDALRDSSAATVLWRSWT